MNSESKEEQTRGKTPREKARKERVFWAEGMPKMMAECCRGKAWDGSANMPRTMARCCKPMMRACRWFLLIPIVLAGAALLLGYYLSPVTVRVLWLAISGTVVLTVSLCLILAVAMWRARARS